MSILVKNWAFTWITPLRETLFSSIELPELRYNSSNEAQFVVEIRVVRSTKYWDYGDKTITDVEEPTILNLFPVNVHKVSSGKDVYPNCNFMPLVSSIDDYIGDRVPSNFDPEKFMEELEEGVLKICNIYREQVDPKKCGCFLSVVIPIQVVRIVEVYDKDENNLSNMEADYARNIEEYCDCLHCLWRRGYFDHKFVQETIQTVSPASYSSLFDVVDIKEFSGCGGEEHKDECSICWKEFKHGISISELPCFHVFHTKCIVNWFARVNNCPLCRSRVDPLKSGS